MNVHGTQFLRTCLHLHVLVMYTLFISVHTFVPLHLWSEVCLLCCIWRSIHVDHDTPPWLGSTRSGDRLHATLSLQSSFQHRSVQQLSRWSSWYSWRVVFRYRTNINCLATHSVWLTVVSWWCWFCGWFWTSTWLSVATKEWFPVDWGLKMPPVILNHHSSSIKEMVSIYTHIFT